MAAGVAPAQEGTGRQDANSKGVKDKGVSPAAQQLNGVATKGGAKAKGAAVAPLLPPEESSSDGAEEGGGVRKLSRKEKRMAKASAPPKGGFADDDGRTCKVCGERFGSRSALFRHIEETGHASLRQ